MHLGPPEQAGVLQLCHTNPQGLGPFCWINIKAAQLGKPLSSAWGLP